MNAMHVKELIQLKRESPVGKIMFFAAGILSVSVFGIRTNILLWVMMFMFNSGAVGSILRLDVPTYWNRWCVAAPIPRADVIKSKYALVMIYETAALVVCVIGMWIFISTHIIMPIKEIRYAVSVMSFLFVIDTIKLVCIFWRGGYHGGNLSYCINLALVLVFLVLPISFSSNAAWIFLVFSAAVRIASLPLSVRLYNRRSL